MSNSKFTPPAYKKQAFNCPHCGAFAHQRWLDMKPIYPNVKLDISVGACVCCEKQSVWVQGKMLFPDSREVSMPNEDLSDGIKADYLEAASVLQKSPRASAALLRLALQKLCRQLGGKGDWLQKDIDILAEKGISSAVIQAMDSVRIIGNEALHPGQIDLRDDHATAETLFKLINFIAEKMLTEPQKLQEFYAGLPDSKKRKNLSGKSDKSD